MERYIRVALCNIYSLSFFFHFLIYGIFPWKPMGLFLGPDERAVIHQGLHEKNSL